MEVQFSMREAGYASPRIRFLGQTKMTLTEYVQPMLDKRLPAALVAAFLLQTAGALFWAGSAA
jgi:hypothetical protein